MTTTPKTTGRTVGWIAPPAPPGRSVHPRPLPPDVRWDLGAFCPLDDTLLQTEPAGWSCPSCGAAWDHAGDHGWWLTAGTDLAARLQAEDALQAAGLVTDEQRSTCSTCRTWVTFDHTASHMVGHTAGRIDPDGSAASGGRSRFARRRSAIIAAAVVETALLCQLAGYLTQDRWAHLVPAGLAWWIAGGLVAAAAVVGAGWALARWWRGWWPYRHNRLLDTPLPVPDGTRGSTGVRGGGS